MLINCERTSGTYCPKSVHALQSSIITRYLLGCKLLLQTELCPNPPTESCVKAPTPNKRLYLEKRLLGGS